MVHKYAGEDKEGEEVWLPVATPFGVPARVRHADQAEAYGLRMTVQDMDGRPRALEFDRAVLPRVGATEIRAQLFTADLRTEADGEAVAVQALKAADPVREIVAVSRPGWHSVLERGGPAFVLPSGEVIAAPEGSMLELAAPARLPDVDITEVNRAVPQATLDAMAAIEEHSGHAGPAFVQGLFDHGHHRDAERLRQIVFKAAGTIAGDNADSRKDQGGNGLRAAAHGRRVGEGVLPASWRDRGRRSG